VTAPPHEMLARNAYSFHFGCFFTDMKREGEDVALLDGNNWVLIRGRVAGRPHATRHAAYDLHVCAARPDQKKKKNEKIRKEKRKGVIKRIDCHEDTRDVSPLDEWILKN
jgi:hypothetical protein